MIKFKLHHYQPIYPKYLLFVLDVSLDVGSGPGIRVRDGVLGITMISHQKMDSFLIAWKELLLIKVLSFWWNSSLAIQSSSDKRRHEFTFSSPPLPVRKFQWLSVANIVKNKYLCRIFLEIFLINLTSTGAETATTTWTDTAVVRRGVGIRLLFYDFLARWSEK